MSVVVYPVVKAETEEQILKCFDILKGLRPHLEKESYLKQIQLQRQEGFELIFIEDEQGIKSVAGYRIAHFLAWGKVLYVDDLITRSEARGTGFGTHLIKWLISEAKIKGCQEVHLDMGIEAKQAHRLYLNLGFTIDSLHLSTTL